ncbi:hypothetical protein B0H14DRAFT_2585833 [Mycena olivaceomarginata]|nr:hypothetical protein B0H14DRAFT_2585833 [Mycena olivaceomarginata]
MCLFCALFLPSSVAMLNALWGFIFPKKQQPEPPPFQRPRKYPRTPAVTSSRQPEESLANERFARPNFAQASHQQLRGSNFNGQQPGTPQKPSFPVDFRENPLIHQGFMVQDFLPPIPAPAASTVSTPALPAVPAISTVMKDEVLQSSSAAPGHVECEDFLGRDLNLGETKYAEKKFIESKAWVAGESNPCRAETFDASTTRKKMAEGNHGTLFPGLSKVNPREYIVSGWSKINQAEAPLNILQIHIFHGQKSLPLEYM